MDQHSIVLSKELEKCFTPATGRNIACLIQTEKGEYLGHNVEIRTPIYFFHAEEMAIAKMLDEEPTPIIKKLIVWGSGLSDSFKNVIPCFDCFEKIRFFMDDETRIEAMHPDITQGTLILSIADLKKAYSAKSETAISGSTRKSIINDLKKKTILQGADLEFVADVRLWGVKEQIAFFLIGSTAGKGGASQLVMEKTGGTYRDIDLLAITSKDPIYIENEMQSILKRYYDSCLLIRKESPVPKLHTTRLRRKLECSKGKIHRLVDLDIGDNLERIVHKPEYIKRNWFHWLSKANS